MKQRMAVVCVLFFATPLMAVEGALRHIAKIGDNCWAAGDGGLLLLSKDDGKTWSPLNFVFGAGRQHANLLRLANGDLVMTMIRRLDLKDAKLASYRRGCDAVISRDNGLTWDVDHMYVLDEFSGIGTDNVGWYRTLCGHVFSILLDDGRILTTYGNYRNAGALILWKP